MLPYLRTICLNGMDKEGNRHGRKILPLGQGALDLELLADHLRQRLSRARSGSSAIRMDDAEERLQATTSTVSTGSYPSSKAIRRGHGPTANSGAAARRQASPKPAARLGPRRYIPRWWPPFSRTPEPPATPARGALLFASPKLACLSCHRAGGQGAMIGPGSVDCRASV